MKEQDRIPCKLCGEDGNIFNLIGIACRALRRAGRRQEAEELNNRITVREETKSYDAALGIIMEYVYGASGEDEEYD